MRQYNVLADKSATKGNVRIDLEWIGEGWSGDYDPDEPLDDPLLRFSVYRQDDNGEWQEVDDASYCTRLVGDKLTAEDADLIFDYMFQQIGTTLSEASSIKRICERLSWMGMDLVAELRKSNQIVRLRKIADYPELPNWIVGELDDIIRKLERSV